MAQVAVLAVWARRVGTAYSEDFDVHYAAAKLLLSGHRDALYSVHAQLGALDASGGQPLHTLNPAGWGPVGLATVLPFAYLSLPVAVALWTVLQVVALCGAAVVAVRGGGDLDPTGRLLLLGALLAAPGLTALVVLGQWEGVAAVLLLLTWADTARGRAWRSAAWALLLAGALPQLAVGLLLFQVAWGGRAQLARLAAGTAVLGCASLALLGSGGLAGWLDQVAELGRGVHPAATDGLLGLAADLLGTRPYGLALAALAMAAAAAACWWLGRRARSAGVPASTALAVSALSLLLSPHLFHYGLAMLAPLAALALLGRCDARHHRLLLAVWAALGVLTVAALRSGTVWWQPLVPLTLVALAAAAVAPSWSRLRAQPS